MNSDEKTCPRCAEMIKRAAVVCRFCGHEFAPAPPPESPADAASRDPSLNAIIGGVIGVVGLILFIAMCSANRSTGDLAANKPAMDSAMENLISADANVTSEVPVEEKGWGYDAIADEVRGGTIYRASIDSQNSTYFDFPYNGGSTLTLTIRKHPEYGTDVIFDISKGQFTCGIDDCSGTINFGSGPESISLVEPED